MAKGKQKYRDVVGNKKTYSSNSRNPKLNKKLFKRPRKTFSLYKNDHNRDKPKRDFKEDYEESEAKRVKVEENVVPSSSSEEEEEEDVDHMKQLLGTFSDSFAKKKGLAIESSDDEEEIEEEEEQIADESVSDDSKSEESEEEIEIEAAESKELPDDNLEDPFIKHINYDLHDNLLNALQSTPVSVNSVVESWPKLGQLLFQIPKCDEIIASDAGEFSIAEKQTFAPLGQIPKKLDTKSVKPKDFHIKSQIENHLKKANKALYNKEDYFTPLQSEIYSIINNYQDFYFAERNFDNAEEIRFVYCLHAVNHILKTRLKIIHHNARLSTKSDVPEEFRDQGLVRPKILIVVPFKAAALKVVQTIIDITLPEEKGTVSNKTRFTEDYTGNEISFPKKNPKPEDYEVLFAGNTSDDFKIGLTVTKKSIKLYADFYAADIIIASPLGLRTVIGAEGEPERDYDFLASIELLIFDQTEIFLMQNWDHILHIFNHIHLQPKAAHGTDFSRVRTWSLNGWSKYYRQTLIFSSLVLPEINSIFNKKCMNYAGKVKTANVIELGCISQVFVQLPHVFHKFEAHNAAHAIEARFEFFLSKILPQQRESLMKQTLVFVPNYFDYVRVRNYFKREDIQFVQICEYSKEGKVARARDMFFHGDAHFLLYTERYHFFNRVRVKGIRHLVFYQPPNFPQFYYEMCNLMQEGNMNKKIGNTSNMTVTVLYSKYDVHQLAQIVGTERAQKMVQSDRKVHMMLTGAD